MLKAGVLAPLVDLLGGLGLLFAIAAILRRGRMVGAALSTLAAEYVVVDASGHVASATVIAYAVGLILVAELLLWSGELPSAALADRAVVAMRLLVLSAIAAASALLALIVLAAGSLQLPHAFEAALLGSAAAAALLALPWLLVRRTHIG
jgi:hypothetical protein